MARRMRYPRRLFRLNSSFTGRRGRRPLRIWWYFTATVRLHFLIVGTGVLDCPRLERAKFAISNQRRGDHPRSFVSIKPFVYGQSRTPVPTVYGDNHSFHRSGEVNKCIVGEGFPLPPVVLVKSFVYGSPRTSTPTVYGGNRSFHHNRGINNYL